MKISFKGKSFTLKNEDFIDSGGEGEVYRFSKNLVVKVPTKPERYFTPEKTRKIQKLSAFSHPYGAMPEGLALGKNQKPVGVVFPFVKGSPLVQFFPGSFWKKTGFSFQDAEQITRKIRDFYLAVHKKKWLIVDGNEYNVLISKSSGGYHPTQIDTDSFYIGEKKQALVQMPALKDYRFGRINEGGDWYAFAVVTFQLFVGIHPFRGSAEGYGKRELERRVRDGVSVFQKNVKVPASVRPISEIPSNLKDWYKEVFQEGLREPPPSDFGVRNKSKHHISGVKIARKGKLVFEVVADNVRDFFEVGLYLTVEGELKSLSGKNLTKLKDSPSFITSEKDGFLLAFPEGKIIFLSKGKVHSFALSEYRPEKTCLFGDGLYALRGKRLEKVESLCLGGKVVPKARHVLSVPENAFRLFPGLGIARFFGKTSVFGLFGGAFPYGKRLAELDEVRIVDAKGFRKGAAFLYEKEGEYHLALFSGNVFRQHSLSVPELIVSEHPKGHFVAIKEDGCLLLEDIEKNKKTRLEHPEISTDSRIFYHQKQLYLIKRERLFRVKTV